MKVKLPFFAHLCSDSLRYFGLALVDVEKQRRAGDALPEVLSGILDEPGKSSRILKIQLAFRLSKHLELTGGHGDIQIVANIVGISGSFAKRILLHSLNGGAESDLFERKKPFSAFENTEWPERLNDFAFRPDNARSVPGKL